jgi:hypothetical protein
LFHVNASVRVEPGSAPAPDTLPKGAFSPV